MMEGAPPAGAHGAGSSIEVYFLAQEGPRSGALVPSLDAYILPGAGHNFHGTPNARERFASASHAAMT